MVGINSGIHHSAQLQQSLVGHHSFHPTYGKSGPRVDPNSIRGSFETKHSQVTVRGMVISITGSLDPQSGLQLANVAVTVPELEIKLSVLACTKKKATCQQKVIFVFQFYTDPRLSSIALPFRFLESPCHFFLGWPWIFWFGCLYVWCEWVTLIYFPARSNQPGDVTLLSRTGHGMIGQKTINLRIGMRKLNFSNQL